MKRRIVKGTIVVILLLIVIFLLKISPAQYEYHNDNLVGISLPVSEVQYDDYIVLDNCLKRIIAKPGDIITYKNGLCRNGELILEGIKIPSMELKEYCIYDGEQIEYLDAQEFTLFYAVSNSAKAMLFCMFVLVVIVCFIFS